MLLGSILAILAVIVHHAALVFWAAALVMFAAAVIGAAVQVRNSSRRGTRPALLAVAFAVTAALGAVTALAGTDAVSTAGVPRALHFTTTTSATGTVVAASHRTVTYAGADKATLDGRAEAAIEKSASAVSAVTGGRAAAFAAVAQTAGYVPRSGLVQDFSAAAVQRDNTYTYVTVPLHGTDIPEMSKVTYAVKGSETSVVEMMAATSDGSHASLRVWQDGTLINDVTVYDPARDTGKFASGVQNTGFSMSRLQNCLTNAGVAAWLVALIGATCSVTCALTAGAGCLACAVALLGFTSGAISACVYGAFT